MSIIAAALGAVGSVVSSFFGFKKDQSKIVQSSLEVLGQTNESGAKREAAIAAIITAESNSGYWLSAVWRPLMMVFFAALLASFWFGYAPPNINGEMPPILAEIFLILKIGIGGYIPARSIEKIVSNLNLGSILKTFIKKKLG